MTARTGLGVWTLCIVVGAADDAQSQRWMHEESFVSPEPSVHDGFSLALAVDGDVAVVGAPLDDTVCTPPKNWCDSGAAWVYERVGTSWRPPQKLLPGDLDEKWSFGRAVAVDGNTLLVGATGVDLPGVWLAGAVYVFERGPDGWRESARLTASDPGTQDDFGGAVALEGDLAVVGARLDDDAGRSSGAAYVFERVDGVWSEVVKLRASDAAESHELGLSVALSGETVLASAHGDATRGPYSGAAYVFVREGGVWVEQAKLLALDWSAWDSFGYAVALSGDTAVIGAPGCNDQCSWDPHGGSGAAYVFQRTGTSWSQQAKLLAIGGGCEEKFGYEVAVWGDAAVVGIPRENRVEWNSGSARLFERTGKVWSETQTLVPHLQERKDQIGETLAMSATTILVGARGAAFGLGAVSEFRFGASYPYVDTRRPVDNADSYTASAPRLGEDWTATVDLTTTGHSVAQLIGLADSTTRRLPGPLAQIVLVEGPQLFRLPARAGPLAQWTAAIPAEPSLAGRMVYTQALHLQGPTAYALSNSQDLFLH